MKVKHYNAERISSKVAATWTKWQLLQHTYIIPYFIALRLKIPSTILKIMVHNIFKKFVLCCFLRNEVVLDVVGGMDLGGGQFS